MVYGIVKWVIISLVLIMLVHHLFSFLKNTLTVPKVKDYVHKPSELYKEIENTVELSNKIENLGLNTSVPNIDTTDMKNELKSFFNELNQNNQNNQNNQPNSFASKSMFSEL